MCLPESRGFTDYVVGMPGLARPRGPHPATVYWRRRLVALAVAVGVMIGAVVGVQRLLSLGSDADSTGRSKAVQAAAPVTVTITATPRTKRTRKGQPPVLAQPEGPCDPADVVITPVVPRPVGGADVLVKLKLQTKESLACTFTVSADAVTMKITSGSDLVWTSLDCPRAIPEREVVVRSQAATRIDVIWPARRSDETCSKLTDWAGTGWYHVAAAALGGEPTDVQFELVTPPRPTVTRTVTPTATPTRRRPGRPVGSPSGAVEPTR